MTNLRRLWNNWAPHPIKCMTSASFSFSFLVLGTLTFALLYNLDLTSIFGPKGKGVCFDEWSFQRSGLLNASARIRIIPSSPLGKATDLELQDREESKRQGKEAEENESSLNTQCIPIPAPPYKSPKDSVTICIHDPEKDKIISAYLKRHSEWERENIQALYYAHLAHPDMMLVDLGCNLGVFTLQAAYMGMQVLAVDAMMSSLKLLQKSLFINGLSCHVTIVNNALYRERMTMRLSLDPINVGGSRVVELLASREDKITQKNLINAICLDDLLPLVKGREVFLKMDIEASEDAVLECADQFFKEVNVKVFLLEWLYFRNQEDKARAIVSFLILHDMKPVWDLEHKRDIDIQAAHAWPDNVFWIKNVKH
ncbi:hypothetical protein PoB_006727000 [Plakobranchus ocellatus]|uniref:Methyltransferase FkbM domain-containing protein n=1 Tax=Plakobranchus ocellatus TaxID=259542 RepID=A0AAV4D9H5_9GAST|nr:hypothetical protein PoB_006727000 [Plakobranchus ocellatus]